MGIAELTAFFGWMTVINLSIIAFTGIFLVFFINVVSPIHQKMFELSDVEIKKAYFKYLANYKMLFITFNLVPYIALKFML
ncbi:DUF6868 family protein [Thalassotalea agarivorans]|uniref:DUF6868 domain-containing protein n=1 Tax=Thalassotalea agarivorans TaxID=349064 RepID=A0A1I0GPR7_THASX|nr:hypothetical protein [Thalassotalea agarivorans]SET72393.1 hypothetical protein SAMN05660429_02516 [Thalassotalea agarivorans]